MRWEQWNHTIITSLNKSGSSVYSVADEQNVLLLMAYLCEFINLTPNLENCCITIRVIPDRRICSLLRRCRVYLDLSGSLAFLPRCYQ